MDDPGRPSRSPPADVESAGQVGDPVVGKARNPGDDRPPGSSPVGEPPHYPTIVHFGLFRPVAEDIPLGDDRSAEPSPERRRSSRHRSGAAHHE
ncbi:hypothetical protein [Saccharothrix syringae]|uniref:hypothetical protein n=1 Tax=Saccharothrix syringae TaxID=103733 RepID=UPI000B2ED540|nr:hypothetical protein [Saccharothrix syringae]